MRAPDIMVEVVLLTEEGEVDEMRALRLRVSCSSTMRKGRYLLRCEVGGVVEEEDMVMSPSVSASVSGPVRAVVGVG